MVNKVDIREIAQYCKNEYEQECEKSECKCAYSIVYVAITLEGEIKVSTTPHVLVDAERCYLIHRWSQKAVSCWYSTFAIQSVNIDGEVRDGYFDEEYSFTIDDAGFNRAPCIYLKRNGNVLYSESFWSTELTNKLIYIWKLYNKCKAECKTLYESTLFCQLAKKEKTISDLEKKLSDSTLKEQYLRGEISQYRELLDDIKSAIKSE
jgi:hypothetical protein